MGEGPIELSSETDLIFRLYRPMQSVDFKFRFLYRPMVLVCFISDIWIDRPFFRFKAPIFVLGDCVGLF